MQLSDIVSAAHDHKVLTFMYIGKKDHSMSVRHVEPYEIKGDSLYAFDLDKASIRNFKLNSIFDTKVTDINFVPRFQIKI